jgi:C-terminal processing protease CtpA/Prc
MMKRLAATILALTLVWPSTSKAAEKGWFGFELKIAGEGLFNPTVRSVTVASIAPESPAAAAKSIAMGDEIVQVEETSVQGRKASELKPLIQKQVGETIHLRLKRRSGEVYSVTLVAAKNPG